MGMAVLSVDLAYRRWSDLGIVILERVRTSTSSREPSALTSWMPIKPMYGAYPPPGPPPDKAAVPADSAAQAEGAIHCEMIRLDAAGIAADEQRGPVDAEMLAARLNQLCSSRNIRVLVLDGPQAWKSSSNGLEYARVSERQLNKPAKTGLPGLVKPLSARPYSEFCMDVYDALARRGWHRLNTRNQPADSPERVLVESYPHAAWKSLGIKPLPGKRRARISDLAETYAALRAVVPITTNRPPNHDQLQAIVGGLPGLALDERNTSAARIVGKPPRREDGHWREGFIVLPVPPNRAANLRWLH